MAQYNVNTKYDYSIDILGSFSGGTAPPGSTAPHPIAVSYSRTASGDTVVDLSAIALGGVYGLNN